MTAHNAERYNAEAEAIATMTARITEDILRLKARLDHARFLVLKQNDDDEAYLENISTQAHSLVRSDKYDSRLLKAEDAMTVVFNLLTGDLVL